MCYWRAKIVSISYCRFMCLSVCVCFFNWQSSTTSDCQLRTFYFTGEAVKPAASAVLLPVLRGPWLDDRCFEGVDGLIIMWAWQNFRRHAQTSEKWDKVAKFEGLLSIILAVYVWVCQSSSLHYQVGWASQCLERLTRLTSQLTFCVV